MTQLLMDKKLIFWTFQTCSPKELLIGLLEQLEQDDPITIAESLCLLLSPLQKGKEPLNLSYRMLKIPRTSLLLLPTSQC